jgi:hypothetical protein
MAATAENVSFDILLGGKVTPEVLKALKDMEERLKQFGATTRTVNAVMARAYRETFEGAAKEGTKAFEKLEHESKSAFHKMAEHAKEASEKIHEHFEHVFEWAREMREKMFEFFGISGVIGAVTSAVTFEELIKHGMEVFTKREEAVDTLAATLRGRGREDLLPGYKEAIENLSKQAPIGYEASADIMRKLAATGKFRGPEEAERFARSLAAVSGGTKESTETAFGAFEKMLLGGKVTPKAIAGLSKGSGFSLLAQVSHDTGIAISDLSKAFGPKGDIGPVKALNLLQKAILELGEGPAAGILEARLKGTQGLFYRLGEDWENFLNKVGELWSDIIDPIANSINEWLDSINWNETFSAMIEKSKEWGQTIKNVMALVFDSPVIKRFQAMWDGFMQRLIGGDMYGPWVRAWNKLGEHVAGQWHWERQLTPQGEKFMKEGAAGIESILNKIADFFQWIYKNGNAVAEALRQIVFWFLVLQGIELASKLALIANAFFNLGKGLTEFVAMCLGLGGKLKGAAAAAEGTAAVGKTIEKAPFPRPGPLAGRTAGFGWEIMFGQEFKALRELNDPTKSGKGYESYAQKQLTESSEQGRKFWSDLFNKIGDLLGTKAKTGPAGTQDEQTESLKKLNALNEQVRKTQEQHNKAIRDATKGLYGHSPGFIPAIEDATKGLTAFVPAVQQAMQALASMQFGLSGAGGGIGGPAGPHETEYGPAVAGDQPGGATYDWNSYHHIGAWPGTTGPLRAGDVALGLGAQAQYHVQPGESFMTASGHWVRFADRSGSKDPYNIDYFKGALGGIVTRPTHALIGEAGPEAVIPLNKATPGLGSVNVTVNFGNITAGGAASDPRTMFREFAETIAAEVHRVISDEHRRSAVV